MTRKEEARIAKWLYRKGTATEEEFKARFKDASFGGGLPASCNLFTLSMNNAGEVRLKMTAENIDNYRRHQWEKRKNFLYVAGAVATIAAGAYALWEWLLPVISRCIGQS